MSNELNNGSYLVHQGFFQKSCLYFLKKEARFLISPQTKLLLVLFNIFTSGLKVSLSTS